MRNQNIFHHDHLQCIRQQLGQDYINSSIRTKNVQSSTALMGLGKNHVYPSNSEVCSKYNQCMESKNQSREQDQINNTSFTIPSQILHQEQYQNIQILPFTQTLKTKYETQLMVNDNLLKKKKQKLYQMHLLRQQQQQRLNKLEELKQKSRKKLQQCPKKRLSEEKRPGWNHSIFGQIKQSDFDKNKSKEQKSLQKDTERSKSRVALQPIKERITKYLQKQKNKKQQIQLELACKHVHTCPQKDLQEKKMEIEKNSKAILKKMKQQKRKVEQKRKMIKGKIRAIQLQSRASLKKFKKKPVDPNIQFIVQIPNKQKKQKIQKVEEQNQGKCANKKNMGTSNNRKRGDDKNKNRNQKKNKGEEKIEKQNNPENKIIQNQGQQQQGKKFYFWQIPIYNDDINKIDINFKQTEINEKPRIKKSSFRQEVDNYLSTRNHSKMQEYNKKQKQRKFTQLVQEKKEIFLQEYSQQSNDQGYRNQIFWNQEQLYKLSNIKNFN